MSDPTVTAFLTKVLCKHGGRLPKKDLSGLLELPTEQMEQILKEEPQKFPQVGDLVLAGSPVRTCTKYLKNEEEEEQCEKLHLCQNYLRSNCKRPRCPFSHDIFSNHNRMVMKANEISGLNEDEIKVLLLQNDNQLLPRVCVKYLHDQCNLGKDCSWLHICGFFTRGECTHHPCKRSHHLLEFGSDLLLTRYRMSEETIQNFQMICTVKYNERLQTVREEGKKDQEKGQPGAQRGRGGGRPRNRKKREPQDGARSKSRGQRQGRAGVHSRGRSGSHPVSESGDSHCMPGSEDVNNSQITQNNTKMAASPPSLQPLMSLDTHPPTPTVYMSYTGHSKADVESASPSAPPKVSPQTGIPTGHSSSSSTPSAPLPKWTFGQVTSIHPVNPLTVSAAGQSKPVHLPMKDQSSAGSVRPAPSTVVNPSTSPMPPPRPSKMVNSPTKGPSVPQGKPETTTIASPNKTQPVVNLTTTAAGPSSTTTTSCPRLVDSPTEGPSVQRVKPVQPPAASFAQTSVKPISQTELEDIYTTLFLKNLEGLATINPSDTGHQAARTSVNGATYLPPNKLEPDKVPEICLSNIWKYCKLGERCPDMHYYLPYRWQIYKGTDWEEIPNMEEIEKCYCDPSADRVRSVDFMTMKSGEHRVRRLSTVSSVMKPPEYVLTTEWLWYWKDEYGTWTQYGHSNVKQVSSTILSSDLETVYLSDPTAVIPFTAGSQRYEINFPEMKQRNVQYKTEKDVRRRPKYLSFEDVKLLGGSTKSSATKFPMIYPRTWDTSALPAIGCKKVPVSDTSSEFSEIISSFTKTVSGHMVKNLWRLQNPSLWQLFQWQKEQMEKKNRGQDVKEMRLFHGTNAAHVDAICSHNFDWWICGTNGVVYGQGSYFARDASYSHTYSAEAPDGTRSMFVARVLVGDYVEGNSKMKRPPQRPGINTRYYDSCVNNVTDPSIFVVFERHQIYPEYLLEYEERYRSWDIY
ncbi:zinc finger CCCH-type antiviral protein 1-like [Hyla sarda]|uniref:zinc finger CCCH-type antiviral protein 1-like n=1 Tax=Hyla sarda TaxID=327740 RepID=UPI0024C30B79|nr:zinc finger CCCH-type antiviral protein 1-like [Hyla sarda]